MGPIRGRATIEVKACILVVGLVWGGWRRVGRVFECVPAFWAGLIEATLGQKGVLVVCVCVVLCFVCVCVLRSK